MRGEEQHCLVYLSASCVPSNRANSVQVAKMCAAFAQLGLRVVLISPWIEHHIFPSGDEVTEWYKLKQGFEIQHVRLPIARGRSILLAIATYQRLRRLKPSVVVGRFLPGCTVATLMGYKTIYEAHCPSWEMGWREDKLFRYLVKRVELARIVFISSVLKGLFHQRYSIPNEKTIVLHDGADDVDEDALEKTEKSVFTVGYIGSLGPGKGIDIVISAARKMPDVRFLIVGGSPEEIAELKNEVTENVKFLGYYKHRDISTMHRQIDVAMLPNQRNMFSYGSRIDISGYNSPLKLFEYMAHGKAIIASDLPVLREVLDPDCAIFVSGSSADDWCDAVNRLRDAKTRNAIGQRALSKFMRNYQWRQRAMKMLEGI